MKKNYLYLILLLLSNLLVIGQTVTLTPTTVNGVSTSTGPINLGSTPNSTISLSVNVQFPAGAAVGDQGTIIIYFSGAGLGTNTALGGNGGALYFGGGQAATRTFTINLDWTDFQTSGGYIYAEYKNSATYKSTNISVIKNATMSTGTNLNPPADAPNPSNITNTLCCNQTIRLGDKPAPIIGSQYLNPYQNEPYGINSSWNIGTSNILDIDGINSILTLDYMTELKSFTVTRGLGYRYKLDFPNKSNTVTITVVPSPILRNEISVNASVDPNGFFEISTTSPKTISGTRQGSQVNLNILQDPSHISQRGDTFTEIERFEWQYTKTNINLSGYKNWITINSNHPYNLESFAPSDITNNEANYYLLRRVAIYQNIKRISNTLKIVLRTINRNNTICCDQTLVISSNTIDTPTLITGSVAEPDSANYLKYQWQSQSIDSNTSAIGNWTNIVGANSKDYLPLSLQLVSTYDRRSGKTIWMTPTTYNYRRIAESLHNEQSSYSNEINISSANYIYISPNPIIVYPNPASSIINIQNNGTTFILANTSITIVNILGSIMINSNAFSIINQNLISVDISNLPIGTYFINIPAGENRSIKTTFFKNN